MEKQRLYEKARDSIIEADESRAMSIILEAQKDESIDLLDLLLYGFGDGNEEIGEHFDDGSLSLPELIYAAEVMRNVTDTILEMIADDENARKLVKKGKILLATVEGDVHDIGKGIVASTLKSAGFEVIDLGCEVPANVIVEKAIEYEVDIIGTSALLTSTMVEQKKLIKLLEENSLSDKFITMVGGAPCTKRWAKRIGASGYSEDAVEAVRVANELIGLKKE
ncbi:MAG TPA: cobalamin-dependent protein [Anaerovoracaceae bacterium]|nr:cobalamin-dependent protein [Anaerovoracaceae bacterium]